LPLLQRGAVEIRGAGAVAVKLTVVEELPTSWTTSSITPSTSFSVPPTLLPLLAGSNGHGGMGNLQGQSLFFFSLLSLRRPICIRGTATVLETVRVE
jgi:hypothetical protein